MHKHSQRIRLLLCFCYSCVYLLSNWKRMLLLRKSRRVWPPSSNLFKCIEQLLSVLNWCQKQSTRGFIGGDLFHLNLTAD